MSWRTARKRWLMAGPWAHPKTGILNYRKTAPPDLWAACDRLAALGVRVTREVHRSLRTKISIQRKNAMLNWPGSRTRSGLAEARAWPPRDASV